MHYFGCNPKTSKYLVSLNSFFFFKFPLTFRSNFVFVADVSLKNCCLPVCLDSRYRTLIANESYKITIIIGTLHSQKEKLIKIIKRGKATDIWPRVIIQSRDFWRSLLVVEPSDWSFINGTQVFACLLHAQIQEFIIFACVQNDSQQCNKDSEY